jgi:hypothetical protein
MPRLITISRRLRSLQGNGFLRVVGRHVSSLLAGERFPFRSLNVEVGPMAWDGDNYEIWTEVAGVSYNNNRGHPRSRQEIIRRYCRDGNELSLVPEPWNKHSRTGNAVGLWIRGGGGLLGRSRYQVGYVPESDSAEVAEWLRRGKRATAFIWSVVGGGDLYYGLRINIVLHDAKLKADPARPRQKKSKARVSPKPEILDVGDLGINVNGKPPRKRNCWFAANGVRRRPSWPRSGSLGYRPCPRPQVTRFAPQFNSPSLRAWRSSPLAFCFTEFLGDRRMCCP